jgi:alpha-mannosidase
VDEAPGELQRSFFEIESSDVQASSVIFKGNDMYVRFFNTSSRKTNHIIDWNVEAAKVETVDLNGDVLSKVDTGEKENGTFRTVLHLPQFGIKTIKLTDAKK